jgi:hypothetical protein
MLYVYYSTNMRIKLRVLYFTIRYYPPYGKEIFKEHLAQTPIDQQSKDDWTKILSR